MSCNDCTSCQKVTSNVPECWAGNIEIGTIAANNAPVDVEIIKLSNDYRVEASVTSSAGGIVVITLSLFTDVGPTFWRHDGSSYKITLYSGNDRNQVYDVTDLQGTTASCLLLDFTRGNTDFEGDIVLEFET